MQQLQLLDMFTYGHCPARDDFFLVVCNRCGQVVKPQAFEKHCERRHGPVGKFCGRSSPPPDPRQRSRLSYRAIAKGSGPSPGSPRQRPAKTREWVSLPPGERPSQETPLSPTHASSPRPRVPTGPSHPDGPSIASSLEKPQLQKTVAGKGLVKEVASGPQDLRGPRTYKNVYKKECDFNKHCGVLDPGKKKRCTRHLMCNIHSILLRRQVVGRSKTFDQLVTDLRTGAPAGSTQPEGLRTGAPAGSTPPEGLRTGAPAGSTPPEGLRTGAPAGSTQPDDLSLSPGSRVPTPPKEASEWNGPWALLETRPEGEELVDVDHVRQGKQKDSYPLSQGLPSSGEESGGEEEQEMMEEHEGDVGFDLPASSWHPKPLGLCTFGSRPLSCSVFTFDRRLHRLRFAVSAMVERQIGARLWT